MAFTFNWAGFGNPEIKGGNGEYLKTLRDDYGNAGAAVRGWRIDKANKEYADMLDKQHRMSEIQARIKQLEQRNAEIRQQIQGSAQNAVDPIEPIPSNNPYGSIDDFVGVNKPANISGIPIRNAFASFDPKTAPKADVKYVQGLVGTTPDGKWGRKSRRAWVNNPVFLGERFGGWEYPED